MNITILAYLQTICKQRLLAKKCDKKTIQNFEILKQDHPTLKLSKFWKIKHNNRRNEWNAKETKWN